MVDFCSPGHIYTWTMVMSYIKCAPGVCNTTASGLPGLLLHITMNPSSSIAIIFFQYKYIWVQYRLALWRLKFEIINYMQQYSSIIWPLQQINLVKVLLRNLNFLSVQQGVQYCFAKFEFIGHVCVHEQDRWWFSPWNKLENRCNVYKT